MKLIRKKSCKGLHKNLLVLFCMALMFSPIGAAEQVYAEEEVPEVGSTVEEVKVEEVIESFVEETEVEELVESTVEEAGIEKFSTEEVADLLESVTVEKSGIVKEEKYTVLEIEKLDDIVMKVGDELNVPQRIMVRISNGDNHSGYINWGDFSEPEFDEDEPGEYIFTGILVVRGVNVTNADDFPVIQKVIVESGSPIVPKDPIELDKDIMNVGVMGTAIGIGEMDLAEVLATFPLSYEVTLSDGSNVELEVVWNKTSEPVYDKNKVGAYIFSGEFVFKDDVTNSKNHKLNYWVNVVDFDDLTHPTDGEDDEGSDDENEGVDKDKDGEIKEEVKKKTKDNVGKVETETIEVKVKEKDDAVVTKNNDDSNRLPETATSHYSILLVGLLLILLGGTSYYLTRRKQAIVQRGS